MPTLIAKCDPPAPGPSNSHTCPGPHRYLAAGKAEDGSDGRANKQPCEQGSPPGPTAAAAGVDGADSDDPRMDMEAAAVQAEEPLLPQQAGLSMPDWQRAAARVNELLASERKARDAEERYQALQQQLRAAEDALAEEERLRRQADQAQQMMGQRLRALESARDQEIRRRLLAEQEQAAAQAALVKEQQRRELVEKERQQAHEFITSLINSAEQPNNP